MEVDFSGIKDDLVVGFKLKDDPQNTRPQSYKLKALTFAEFIKPYCGGKIARWEVYHNLKDAKDSMERGCMISAGNDARTQQFTEGITTSALEREAIRNAMELMVDVYLSKGLIHNEPLPKIER